MSDKSKNEQQQRREQEERQQRQREEHDRQQAEQAKRQREEEVERQEREHKEHPGRATGLETGPNMAANAIPQAGRPSASSPSASSPGAAGPGSGAGARREQEPVRPQNSRTPSHLTNPGAALLSGVGARSEDESEGEGQEAMLDPASDPPSPNHPFDPGAALRMGGSGPPSTDGEAPTEAPAVVDVPHVMGNGTVGETLNCTMGNWDGEPTSYAYQWQRDGEDFAATGDSYVIAAEDDGHSLSCVVTATNAIGSTTAPPSNAVAVSAAGARGAAARPSGEHTATAPRSVPPQRR